jgi:RNA polymerase sigma factor (sigma-70 family)
LLQRCLHHEAGAWNDFVDRYLGLIYHVVRHTAHLRSVVLSPEDTEDMAAEVLLQLVGNDYAVFRQFQGHSSLATYLTVIARRICVHELVKRAALHEPQDRLDSQKAAANREDALMKKLAQNYIFPSTASAPSFLGHGKNCAGTLKALLRSATTNPSPVRHLV